MYAEIIGNDIKTKWLVKEIELLSFKIDTKLHVTELVKDIFHAILLLISKVF